MTGTAWYGRAAQWESAAEQLRRQYHACAELLPDEPYVACYFDIGVGYRGGTDQPQRRLAPCSVDAVGLPYAGGMAQLLDDASNPTRLFNRVACAALNHVSRNVHQVNHVIDRLGAVEVELLVPSIADLAILANRNPEQHFAAAVALAVLHPDHANRLDRASAYLQSGEGRR